MVFLFVLRILLSSLCLQIPLSAFASFWGNEMVGFVFLMLHLVYDLLIVLSVTHLYRRRRHSSVSCFFAERK
jgi:hypothetical protein